MRLRDYLSLPYLLEAETVEVAPGSWIRRVTYPELPGCTSESLVVEEALRRLERLRIQMIVEMMTAGRPAYPGSPRYHVRLCQIALQHGSPGRRVFRTISLIDRDEVNNAREFANGMIRSYSLVADPGGIGSYISARFAGS